MNKKKAAVYILLGQSNAVGHGVPMKEEDIISKPLKNVFGHSRELNQSFDISELKWTGYTSFGMNLAETQDNTYSVANCLASIWQNEIDNGEDLPDLHIVQIAIGAEGVTKKYKWYPHMEKKLIPGVLGVVNISLFPFSEHIFSLLDKSFKDMGKDYEIIGVHWRGGENEITEDTEYLKKELYGIYREIFDSFNGILNDPPTILHKFVAIDRVNDIDPTGEMLVRLNIINDVFNQLCETYPNFSMFDPTEAPQFIPDVRCNGIFIEDAVHFTPEVNKWVAQRVLEEYIKTK